MNITYSKRKFKISDIILNTLVYVSSILTCLVLVSIVFYILSKGIKGINWTFLSSTYSSRVNGPKGILPMIINSIYIIAITTAIGFPLGLGTAIYTTQYAKSERFKKIISFSSDVLSGIPSIIFGFFGFQIFCVKFGLGTSIIAGCLTMAICVLPTIIRTSEEALRKVPKEFKEAAYALGAKNLRVLFTVTIRTALPEIFASMSLYVGKILGESAIFIYTVGMSYALPKGFISHIFESGSTLTIHLYQIAKQANTSDSLDITFAVSAVLLILVLVINLSTDLLLRIMFKIKR